MDSTTCPACGASVPEEATRCPACAVELHWEDKEDRPWERTDGPGRLDSEPHRANLIKTLGIMSIVCAPGVIGGGILAVALGLGLGIAAWLMARRDLTRMRAAQMDRRGEASTRAGRILGIVGTFLNVAALMLIAAFLTAIFYFG
jgi:hypothetical protein